MDKAWSPEVLAAVDRVLAQQQRTLEQHGAVAMQAGTNFIGYLSQDAQGLWWNEIVSWGVHYGKLFSGPTRDAVETMASQAFDAQARA